MTGGGTVGTVGRYPIRRGGVFRCLVLKWGVRNIRQKNQPSVDCEYLYCYLALNPVTYRDPGGAIVSLDSSGFNTRYQPTNPQTSPSEVIPDAIR